MARARPQATAKQQIYVDSLMEGHTRHASAIAAGYAKPYRLEGSETVRRELAIARDKLTDITQIKRVDIIDGLLDGVSCARMQGDAGNIIKGWVEIAKILGHAQPEMKTVNVNVNLQHLRSRFAALSDEELMEIRDRALTIEADSVG